MIVTVFDTPDAPDSLLTQAHDLCLRAFEGDFDPEDWDHALGGRHFVVVVEGGRVISHAAVVERTIWVGDAPYRTGYVEAVATEPSLQGLGHGTAVMRQAGEWIRERYELGCLGTGEHRFYERLGWQRWRGPSAVRLPDGSHVPTPDDDDGIMVLGTTAAVDVTARIACEPRQGDDW
ncbi:MAG: GNAT family N-acetyltransferase [Acidimicrobiia bacterium]